MSPTVLVAFNKLCQHERGSERTGRSNSNRHSSDTGVSSGFQPAETLAAASGTAWVCSHVVRCVFASAMRAIFGILWFGALLGGGSLAGPFFSTVQATAPARPAPWCARTQVCNGPSSTSSCGGSFPDASSVTVSGASKLDLPNARHTVYVLGGLWHTSTTECG